MTKLDIFVSVIVLVRDNGAAVRELLARLVPDLAKHYTNYEVLLVEDGSRDDSYAICRAELARLPGVRLLRFSRNFGDESAYWAGLEVAIGDVVVTLRPAFDSHSVAHALVQAVQNGKGLAVGVDTGAAGSWLRRRLARRYHSFVRRRLRAEPLPGAEFSWGFNRTVLNILLSQVSVPRLLRFNAGQLGVAPTFVPLAGDQGRKRRTRILWQDVLIGLSVLLANSTAPHRVLYVGGMLSSLGLGAAVLALEQGSGRFWHAALFLLLALFFAAFGFFAEFFVRRLQAIQGRRPYVIVSEEVGRQVWDASMAKNITKS